MVLCHPCFPCFLKPEVSEHCQKWQTCPLATLGIMKGKKWKNTQRARVSSFQASNPSLQLMKINWGEPKSMLPERDRLPFQKAIFFPEESMRWLIASVPPCPGWFMGASVSQSVSSRQEFTDKEAVGQTYPSRATLKTVRKTGSSKPTQEQPRGVLVPALSLCVTPCWATIPFQFCKGSSGQLNCSNIHH